MEADVITRTVRPKTAYVRVLTCSVMIVTLLAGCGGGFASIPTFSGSKDSDEVQIARVLDDVHAGMVGQRIYKVLAHVSRSYRDSEGRDYAAMEAYLGELFSEYRSIRIDRTRPRLFIEGNRARAVESFATRADPANNSSLMEINVQGQVTVYLMKIEGTWKIVEWGSIR